MTDDDLRARLAAIKAGQDHIMNDMRRAEAARDKATDLLMSLADRVSRLEVTTAGSARLAAEVEANTVKTAVTEALERERERADARTRGIAALWSGVAGTISGTVVGLVSYFSRTGSP